MQWSKTFSLIHKNTVIQSDSFKCCLQAEIHRKVLRQCLGLHYLQRRLNSVRGSSDFLIIGHHSRWTHTKILQLFFLWLPFLLQPQNTELPQPYVWSNYFTCLLMLWSANFFAHVKICDAFNCSPWIQKSTQKFRL